MAKAYDVALLTAAPYVPVAAPDDWYTQQVQLEEQLVADGLAARGLTSLRVDWADPAMDWNSVGRAVIRSTWDYFHRFDEFSCWLDAVSRHTRLINDPEIVRWNWDKRYMGDLDAAGVKVVPTRFFAAGDAPRLVEAAQEAGWEEIVLKPVVSGAGRLTFRASGRDEIEALQTTFANCLAAEAMLIQPFQPEIVTRGETSLIVIDGKYTHAVRKIARAGEFRVQDDHGGVVQPTEASSGEIEFALGAVAACPRRPTYARVDIVQTADGPRLMELELIEPELFFRFCPEAADSLAGAIARIELGDC